MRHPTPTETRARDELVTQNHVRANACRFRDGRCLTRAKLYDETAAAADGYRLGDAETHARYARALQALTTHHCIQIMPYRRQGAQPGARAVI